MASRYVVGVGVFFAIMLILVILILVGVAVTAHRIRKLADRWSYAYFSKASCKDGYPYCSAPTRPLSIPFVCRGRYQPDVALYYLSAVGVMVDYVQNVISRLSLPGDPHDVTIFGTKDHPLLAASFLSAKTRFIVFRGTGNVNDLLNIDFAWSQSINSFVGLAKHLLAWGAPTVFSFPQTDVKFGNAWAKVHSGFWSGYLSIRGRLLDTLKDDPPGTQVCVGGHSMGGSISQLCALDLAANEGRVVVMYALASTRVGDGSFAAALNAAVPTGYNIKNTEDAIPDGIAPVLPDFATDKTSSLLEYRTSGQVVSITSHAPSIILCHMLVAYELGILAREGRAAEALPCLA